MSLEPLLNAGLAITPHALMAVTAVGVGALQFLLPKGTMPHKGTGYLWIALMAGVALTGFFIHEIKLLGPFSPIHLLCFVVLASLWSAWRAARKGDTKRHAWTMASLYVLALIVTGGFTLLPGRIMHSVVFGGVA